VAKTKSSSWLDPAPPACQLYADANRQIYEQSEQGFIGQSLCFPRPVALEELIPLPEGSRLFSLPGLTPYMGTPGCFTPWPGNHAPPPDAVAAFLPPAYLRLLLPAAVPREGRTLLPMWAYTAVGAVADDFVVPALRIDPRDHWDVKYYDDRGLGQCVQDKLKQFPGNRLVEHLVRCATEYHCFAAKNFFRQRWECPLPVAQTCNSRCLFCLSEQQGKGFCASQQRINFLPSAAEIADIACSHIRHVPGAIVSFGQGCEGEPILYHQRLREAIGRIRKQVSKGTINLNTNGSLPQAIAPLARSGLDAVRISLNSCTEELYHLYYRPSGYSFQQVKESIRLSREHGLFVALNYLVFPGVNDSRQECDSLFRLLDTGQVDMIQWRNLSGDPWWFLDRVTGHIHSRAQGLAWLVAETRQRYPQLEHGYFNVNTETELNQANPRVKTARPSLYA